MSLAQDLPSLVFGTFLQGFFIADNVADTALLASAHRGAEALRAAGLLVLGRSLIN